MKKYLLYPISLLLIFITNLFGATLPLTDRYFHNQDVGYNYTRGTYLIVMSDASLESILRDESTGDFINFKQTQGYDVVIKSMEDIGGTAEYLKRIGRFWI